MILISTGCNSVDLMCSAVRDDLARCGLPVESLDCARVDYATLSALQARMDHGVCEPVSDDNAVDPRLCALAGWACPESPIPATGSATTLHPLVFVGGIDDSAVFDWNANILAAVRDAGGEAHHVSVAPWQPTAERTADLAASLVALHRSLPGRKLNLVCYAVAGLDCRYLVSPAGLYANDAPSRAKMLELIASITTISTPHRGTRVADAAILALQTSTVTDVLTTFLGVVAPDTIPDDATLIRTLRGLTVDALADFNLRIVDEPRIPLQSFAGISTPSGRLRDADKVAIAAGCVDTDGRPVFFTHPDSVDALNPLLLVAAPFSHTARDSRDLVVTTPSDGMIALASARWGQFRGCLGADHYDVIGQIGNRTRDPLTGFDARSFYIWLAADLAARGL